MGSKTKALMRAARHFETGAFSALLSLRKNGRSHPYLFEAGERATRTACEEALALSALPARLRAEATTYVLEADGFRKTREGTGPFTCLVTRNHPDSIIPLCFDQAGTEVIVPSEIRRGEMIQAGKTNDDFNVERTQGAKNGTVKVPAPGVSYMTSDYNYIYNAEAGQIVKVPAHMMYYAPYLTDEDIGGSEEDGMRNPGLPFINDQGVHGMMISMLNEASDSSEVEQHCAGQLMDPPASMNSNGAQNDQ